MYLDSELGKEIAINKWKRKYKGKIIPKRNLPPESLQITWDLNV